MVNESSNKVSVLVFVGALLIAIVTGASIPATEFILKKKEEERLFLLHQVQAYGVIYFNLTSGSKQQLFKEINDRIIYLDINAEEFKLISEVASPLSSPHSKTFPALDYSATHPDAEEAAKKILERYNQKLNEYKNICTRRWEINRRPVLVQPIAGERLIGGRFPIELVNVRRE